MKKQETPKQFLITVISVIVMFALLSWFVKSDLLKDATKQLFSGLSGKPQRDRIIKNWQAGISDLNRCKGFKERLKSAGIKHDSVATGSFAIDMMTVKESAKKANCLTGP